MKITSIESAVWSQAISGELSPAWSPGHKWSSIETTVYRISTNEGVTGIGASHGSPESIRRVASQLIGRSPFDVEPIVRTIRNSGIRWESLAIAAGIEMALWDLIGKVAGLPLYQLWGAHRSRVKAYASTVEVRPPGQRAEDALRLLDDGYAAIKLRLHSLTMKEDLAVVSAVRDAVGDRMEIMVDANQAQEPGTPGSENGVVWGYERALATCRELADLNVVWVEEPLGRYEFENLTRLSAASDVPISGGENNSGLHEFRLLIDQDCYDCIQPDALVAGGINVFRKIASYAEMHQKPVAPHHGGNGLGIAAHLHLVASTANASYIELLQETPVLGLKEFQSVLAEPLTIGADGYVDLPMAPGLGVELNEDLALSD